MKARPPMSMVMVMCHRRSWTRLEFQASRTMLAAAGPNSRADSAASRTTCCFPSARPWPGQAPVPTLQLAHEHKASGAWPPAWLQLAPTARG